MIESKVIYGCHRYICETSEILTGYLNGSIHLENLQEIVSWGPRVWKSQHRNCPQVTCGYFQLFRYATRMRFGSFPAANEYDVQFAFKFPRCGLITDATRRWLSRRSRRCDR